jgi:hypothetical protein
LTIPGRGEILARLRHPHLAQIHEVRLNQGMPYLVPEYVESGTAEGRLKGDGEAAGTRSVTAREAADRTVTVWELAGGRRIAFSGSAPNDQSLQVHILDAPPDR